MFRRGGYRFLKKEDMIYPSLWLYNPPAVPATSTPSASARRRHADLATKEGVRKAPNVHPRVCSVSHTGFLSLPYNGESLSFTSFGSTVLGNDGITPLSENAPMNPAHLADPALLTTAF